MEDQDISCGEAVAYPLPVERLDDLEVASGAREPKVVHARLVGSRGDFHAAHLDRAVAQRNPERVGVGGPLVVHVVLMGRGRVLLLLGKYVAQHHHRVRKYRSAQQTLEQLKRPRMVFQIMNLLQHVHLTQCLYITRFRLDAGGGGVGHPLHQRVRSVEEPVTGCDLEQSAPQTQYQTALEEALEEQIAIAIKTLQQTISVIKHITRVEKRYVR